MNDQPDPDMFDDGKSEPTSAITNPPAPAVSTRPALVQIDAEREPERWSEDDSSVIFREQPETRVFENNGCTITVMQRASWDEDTDPILTFTKENLPALIRALQLYVPRNG